MHDRPIFGALSKARSLSVAFGYNATQKFSEVKQEKKSTFWYIEKHMAYNFHLCKNAYHRNFTQFSVRMELYGTL